MSRNSALKSVSLVLMTALLATASWLSVAAQTSTYVPAVVSSSVSPVPTTAYPLPLTGAQTNLKAPSYVAVDACGNIYTIDHGYDGSAPITQIPAGGGAATVVTTVGNSYGVTMGQDASHTHLLVSNNYGTSVARIPLINCVPLASQSSNTGGGNGALFYYYDPGDSAGDFNGNTYISTSSTCCVTGNFYLIQEVAGTGNVLLINQPNEITSLAIDKLQNIYFIMGSVVYELPYVAGQYAATPTLYGKYINPVGVSMDFAGNLYVADSSAAVIYEIPNEGTAGPNLKDQFIVSGGININVPVAVNMRGDMYYTASGASSVSELTLGNSNFNSVVIGQSATRVVNFQFNAAATVTNIAAPGGDFSIQAPALGTTACATTTAYGPGGAARCQVTVGFSPNTVGKQSSAVVLTYTIAGVTQTIAAYVEGVGQGALVTIDPGTLATGFSGVKSPAGIVVDHAGNTFIADPGNNAVTEYPAGGGAAINVAVQSGSSGLTTALSQPLGVAVDGAGDVFIADTGNNRVVEVPFVKGALSAAGSTVIASGLKNPSSVYVHTTGDLYVADTGDNAVLVYPQYAGTTNAGAIFGAPTTLGSGMLAPLAVTVDGTGNVYIADSGNNQILGFPLGGGQEIVAADILNPSGLATDSSGSLFVVDQGNDRVLRIPAVQGTLNPNGAAEVGLGIANPYGVAIDAASNLYVTDKSNGAGYILARSQVVLNFGDLAVGTASTALPLTVESAGNLPLTLGQPYFTEVGNSADFTMTSPTGACASGITLASGTNCDLATTFQPAVAGVRSATISFVSTSANAASLTVNGTGVSPSPTTTTLVLVTSVAGAPFYGEPLTLTATVAPTSGTASPTGVVSFIVDGVQVGLEPVVKGIATLPLNSGLAGGAHTVYAVYKGDNSNNGSSSSTQTATISRAPTTPTISITKVPYNNPYSLRHSNAGSCNVTDTNGFTNQFPAILSDGLGLIASVTSPGIGVPSGTLTFYSDGKLINGTVVNVTGYSISSNVITVSVSGTNPLAAGQAVLLSGFGTSTFLDGQTLTVLKAGLSSSAFQAIFTHANASATEAGTATTSGTSVTTLLPAAGGLFSGGMTSDANTLGDGTVLGENNVLVTPHVLTVVYSGDQNYLPSTSTGTTVIVTDVSPTTPVTLPQTPVSPAPYCDANSTITGSRPSNPGSFLVTASSSTITATANTPGTVTLTINSIGGWTGGIDVACPTLPKYTTCSANPGQATLNASTPGATTLPAQVVLTFTTNVPTYIPTATQGTFFWVSSLLLGFVTFSGRRHLRRFKGGRILTLFAVLVLSGIVCLSGCSSNTLGSAATPAGSYPVVVTLTGAQHDNYGYNEVFRADTTYQMPFTLTVQ